MTPRRPITEKQRDYLVKLLERLRRPVDLDGIAMMSIGEASCAIADARKALGMDDEPETPRRKSDPPAKRTTSAEQDAYWKGYHAGRQFVTREIDRAYRDGYREGQHDAALDRELLTRIVAMCHPDKHPPERFGEANALTAALLELRNNNH